MMGILFKVMFALPLLSCSAAASDADICKLISLGETGAVRRCETHADEVCYVFKDSISCFKAD